MILFLSYESVKLFIKVIFLLLLPVTMNNYLLAAYRNKRVVSDSVELAKSNVTQTEGKSWLKRLLTCTLVISFALLIMTVYSALVKDTPMIDEGTILASNLTSKHIFTFEVNRHGARAPFLKGHFGFKAELGQLTASGMR